MNGLADRSRCDTDVNLPFVADAPLRSLADYATTEQALTSEMILGVRGAEVVFANYGAIFADFEPSLRHIAAASGSDAERCRAVDKWLIENTAYVSTSQAASRAVSTPIALDGSSRQAWRPPRYGRAVVVLDRQSTVPTSGAFFDVKGTGVPPDEEPYLPNSNGLMTLDEAVHEVLMEHLVYAVMQRAGVDVRPLPSYAVIDLGFDAVWHDERTPQRATVLVRRAATRPRCQWERAVQGPQMARALMQIELLLRSGGISASVCGAVRFRLVADGQDRRIFRDEDELEIPADRKTAVFETADWKGRDLTIDGVNVQVTSDLEASPLRARLMDFGRYRFREHFDSPLYSWFDADYLNMNGAYLRPDDPCYLQPDRTFGLACFENSEPHNALLARVAEYQQGRASRAEVTAAMRRAVEAAVSLLNRAPLAMDSVEALRPRAVPPTTETGWSPHNDQHCMTPIPAAPESR